MAHQVSLTDDEYKLVLSRLADRLRIAGTAELNGYDRDFLQHRARHAGLDAFLRLGQEHCAHRQRPEA